MYHRIILEFKKKPFSASGGMEKRYYKFSKFMFKGVLGKGRKNFNSSMITTVKIYIN